MLLLLLPPPRSLRLRPDPGDRHAAAAAAAGPGPVHRRHGPADLPGRGTVVLDQLARAAGGPDDHLVQQRRLLARAGARLAHRPRHRRLHHLLLLLLLLRVRPGRLDGRVTRGRRAPVGRRGARRPAPLVVVHGPALGVPRRPRGQHRHGPGQRALLRAERVVPGRQLLAAGRPSALGAEHGLVQLPRLRDLAYCAGAGPGKHTHTHTRALIVVVFTLSM